MGAKIIKNVVGQINEFALQLHIFNEIAMKVTDYDYCYLCPVKI